MDTDYIRKNINLRELIRQDLGKPKFSTAKSDSYCCPLHNETKGNSLVVYDDHWKCYGKCSCTGDVIEWVIRKWGKTFLEACALLGGSNESVWRERPQRRVIEEVESQSTPPTEDWQLNSLQIVEYAESMLWGRNGKRALDYLLNSRGLTRSTIKEHRLGYIPGAADQWRYDIIPGWTDDRGNVPVACGITIPHLANGHLWAVRVRRAADIIGKYHGIRGGSKALYNADSVIPGSILFITEGEFDALLIDQHSFDHDLNNPVCAVSLASASNYRINRYWYPKLIGAPMIAARLDADAAGDKALTQLQTLSPVFRPCQVPVGKDVTDFYLLHGAGELKRWIDNVVNMEVKNV